MLNSNGFLNSIIIFSMLFVTLSGCTTSNFGRLELNKWGQIVMSPVKIKHSFENYRVLPNHKYYYYGTSSAPSVIVGIDDNYELNLTMWVKIDTESDDFRRLIDIVSVQAMGSTFEPWGFRILDRQGNYVGVWYSALRATTVEINDNRQIVNFGPSIVVRGEEHR